MNTETEADVRQERFEIAGVDEESSASAPGASAAEYPFYIVPQPPVPGKTGWSVTAW